MGDLPSDHLVTHLLTDHLWLSRTVQWVVDLVCPLTMLAHVAGSSGNVTSESFCRNSFFLNALKSVTVIEFYLSGVEVRGAQDDKPQSSNVTHAPNMLGHILPGCNFALQKWISFIENSLNCSNTRVMPSLRKKNVFSARSG